MKLPLNKTHGRCALKISQNLLTVSFFSYTKCNKVIFQLEFLAGYSIEQQIGITISPKFFVQIRLSSAPKLSATQEVSNQSTYKHVNSKSCAVIRKIMRINSFAFRDLKVWVWRKYEIRRKGIIYLTLSAKVRRWWWKIRVAAAATASACWFLCSSVSCRGWLSSLKPSLFLCFSFSPAVRSFLPGLPFSSSSNLFPLLLFLVFPAAPLFSRFLFPLLSGRPKP